MNKRAVVRAGCAGAVALLCGSVAATASAATVTLNFDYMATNLYGALPTSVATLKLTDLSDFGIENPIAGASGGVQAEFRVTPGGLAQFASGAPNTTVFIAAYELNFPNTVKMGLPSTGQIEVPIGGPAGYLGGYTDPGVGTFTHGYTLRSDNWAYVDGVNFAAVGVNGTSGGIEWQENGKTWGWGAAVDDPAFGQELNWGSASTMTEGQFSIVNLFNAPGSDSISVAALLANPVQNADQPDQPDALGWIKLRGTGDADPALRGIAASGYWGDSELSGTQYRLNVVALAPAPVPLPAPLALFAPALAGLALRLRRSRR